MIFPERSWAIVRRNERRIVIEASAVTGTTPTTCIFCDIVAGRAPASIVHDDDEFIAFMDIWPVRPGHVLVVPKPHQQYLYEMELPKRKELFALGTQIASALRASELACDDLHMVVNDGKAANQTVPHVHLHVVPRRRGDVWRLAFALGLRPIIVSFGPTSRTVLDRQAALIRDRMDQ